MASSTPDPSKAGDNLNDRLSTNGRSHQLAESGHPSDDGSVNISATTWFSLAVAGMVIALVLLGFTTIWIFAAVAAEERVQRAQALAPIGAAMLAIVTFCTVAWRGILNTQALNYQSMQIKHQAEQIKLQRMQHDAKGEETLASLLVEGTKLVSDKEINQPNMLAGIAALEAVVTAPNNRFATHAMDILVGLVQENYNKPDMDKIFNAAQIAMGKGAILGRYASVDLILRTARNRWGFADVVNGARTVLYINVEFRPRDFDEILDLGRARFVSVIFSGFDVFSGGVYPVNPYWVMTLNKNENPDGGEYRNILRGCRIREINMLDVGRVIFDECDFTGCVFIRDEDDKQRYLHRDLKKSLLGRNNYYDESNPPICVYEGFNFSDYFKVDRHYARDGHLRGQLGAPSVEAAHQRETIGKWAADPGLRQREIDEARARFEIFASEGAVTKRDQGSRER